MVFMTYFRQSMPQTLLLLMLMVHPLVYLPVFDHWLNNLAR